MFYFLHGNDKDAVNDKASSLVADLLKKRPDASFFTLTDESWSDNLVEEYVAGQGLFESKYIVLIKNVFSGDGGSAAEKKARKDNFLEKIEDVARSPNIFIVAESSVDKISLKKIEKHAQKVQEFIDKKSEFSKEIGKGKNDFKIFDLADALGSRDKKTLWMLYRRAIDSGKVPEEIHGILFWQVKNLMIATRTTTVPQSGLNPFVFSKAKAYAQNFSTTEVAQLMEEMVTIYHDAHRGLHDFETALEAFILERI